MRQISRDIIIKASHGDIGAFQEIYNAFSEFVYTVALRVTRTREDAQEVTQDVFMKVYKKLKWFGFKSSLKTWIYRIAVNTAINTSKRSAKNQNRLVEYDDDVQCGNASCSVQKDIDKESNEKHIASLLEQLNPDQRACVVLRNIEEMSYKEIARVLNTNIVTVRTRIKRAREKMLIYSKGKGD